MKNKEMIDKVKWSCRLDSAG